jgi:hypothetical protein
VESSVCEAQGDPSQTLHPALGGHTASPNQEETNRPSHHFPAGALYPSSAKKAVFTAVDIARKAV